MKNADLPAMPVEGEFWIDPTNPELGTETHEGLTKREAFAMAALQGLSGAHNHDGEWNHDSKTVAVVAVKYADALLAELEKNMITSSQRAYELHLEQQSAADDAKADFVSDYIAKHLTEFMDDQGGIVEAIENAPESLTESLNNILANIAKENSKAAQNQLQSVLDEMIDSRLVEMAVKEWEGKQCQP